MWIVLVMMRKETGMHKVEKRFSILLVDMVPTFSNTHILKRDEGNWLNQNFFKTHIVCSSNNTLQTTNLSWQSFCKHGYK